MHFIIAISVAALLFMTGVFLLLKVKKENLGWFFKLAAYKAMVAGMVFITASLCMGICKLSHCGGSACAKQTCIQSCGGSEHSGTCSTKAECGKSEAGCCSKKEDKKCHSNPTEKASCKNEGGDCKNGCQCEEDCNCEHCMEKEKDAEIKP
ncbi:MAG: hypothetical protein HUU48_11605 [Flavobacteriales bacterium]|nr:hypothetical protein [Flavobacteriales bacterium]